MDAAVVNYRTPGDLDEFLLSLQRHPQEIDYKLTVVNVQPDEADVVVVERWSNEMEFDYLEFSENIGYGRACNAAGSRGKGEVIALFNADVCLTEGALRRCTDALLADETAGTLGPRQVDVAERITAGGIFGSGDNPRHRGWLQPDDGVSFSDVQDSVTISGAAFFIKRDVWNELTDCLTYRQIAPTEEGPFLPTSHYYEETWCCYHATAHGWRNVYYGPVRIMHKWQGSVNANNKQSWASAQFEQSREMFRKACNLHGIACD